METQLWWPEGRAQEWGDEQEEDEGAFPTQLHSPTQPGCILWCKGIARDQQGLLPCSLGFGSLTVHAEPV